VCSAEATEVADGVEPSPVVRVEVEVIVEDGRVEVGVGRGWP